MTTGVITLTAHRPKSGEPFTVPRGVPVHSTRDGEWKVSTRKQTVFPTNVLVVGDWTMVTWPGAGGYWRRVVLTNGEFVARWPA